MPALIINVQQMCTDYLTAERLSLVIRVICILLIGIPLLRLITKVTGRLTLGKFSPQAEMLMKRSVYYIGIIIIVISLLNEFGFKLSALLGAAGVFGIAIGFASQTSVSNIISGIFLISEKPFSIGDTIQIGNTTGTVMSIDLLSIKVCTPDNRFVRIPNENMIKTEITNISRFDHRRVNINLSVSYQDDLNAVMHIMQDIADNEPLALKDPAPAILIEQYTPTGVSLLYGVWGLKADIQLLKNNLMLTIKQRFDAESIGIPYTYAANTNPKEKTI